MRGDFEQRCERNFVTVGIPTYFSSRGVTYANACTQMRVFEHGKRLSRNPTIAYKFLCAQVFAAMGWPRRDGKNAMTPLLSTEFVDSDHPRVRAFARSRVQGLTDPVRIARALYQAVRDEIVYDPYVDFASLETYRASSCLAAGRGFCVAKAALLAASARANGIPARVGFADVRNHLASPRLLELVGSDVFIYHGYAALFLDGSWIKATPTFNLALCERFGVKPLDFDGRSDAIFHPFDREGRKHMEYLADRGQFDDVPARDIVAAFRERYPRLFAADGSRDPAFHGGAT